ncbi:TetR/AcrR family transcriptional regulator [Micromonospora sp. NPDC049275]|uniref:TetR/AcrR family transcriptional regulator n=1 Tax=Micromonospora sp. NPDC049275 TaxID=3364268 RepID=UPI00371B012D
MARTVIGKEGIQASLREIARRAEVGLGTLYRHFPTREALLEALLRQEFDRLAAEAGHLLTQPAPAEALRTWMGDFVQNSSAFRGLPASMLATLADERSPLHASCQAMREAGTQLLARAQGAGDIRSDVDGTDLFALVNAVGWVAEQDPTLADRREKMLALVIDALAFRRPD